MTQNAVAFSLTDFPGMEEDLEKVNGHIKRLLSSDLPSMQEMMDYVLGARGKQIRPILTILCSKLHGKQNADATEMAAIVEIFHTASLIHDDIIDNADTRRGRPSVQQKFGRDMALYAGDFMIFSTLAQTLLTAKVWYKDIFKKMNVMCTGEIAQYGKRHDTAITEEQYLNNIVGKTSAMFSAACLMGAYSGSCTQKEIAAVDEYAKNFGLIFQLRDDLRDFLTTEKESKKPVHSDFRNGYFTLPAIVTFRDEKYGPMLRDINAKLERGEDDPSIDEELQKLMTVSGGYEYSLRKMQECRDAAIAALEPIKESDAKNKLTEIVNYCYDSMETL